MAVSQTDATTAALTALLDRYVELVNCGDCGFWNPEEEDEVKAARAALAAQPPKEGGAGADLRAALAPFADAWRACQDLGEQGAGYVQDNQDAWVSGHRSGGAHPLFKFGDLRRASEALAAAPNPPAGEAVGGGMWPLRARVWTRTSVEPHEKVLEIVGSINDTGFTCRHTQPIWVADEDVPGLPERYRCDCQEAAPTPQTDDLAGLSAGATPGEWKLSGQRMGGDWIIATSERVVANCRPWSMRSEDDRNKQDGAFIVALVNAYRSGRLVPAPAAPQAIDTLHGRAWVAAEYRVAGSPHEWTDEDASAMAKFILAGPAPAAPQEIQATQITLGEGLVDITRIDHEGRSGVLFRPRNEHIPFGDGGQLQEGQYWPAAGDVVLWVSGQGPQVAIDALSAFAPAAPQATEEPVADYETRERIANLIFDRLFGPLKRGGSYHDDALLAADDILALYAAPAALRGASDA